LIKVQVLVGKSGRRRGIAELRSTGGSARLSQSLTACQAQVSDQSPISLDEVHWQDNHIKIKVKYFRVGFVKMPHSLSIWPSDRIDFICACDLYRICFYLPLRIRKLKAPSSDRRFFFVDFWHPLQLHEAAYAQFVALCQVFPVEPWDGLSTTSDSLSMRT
jgi:hypothetical protein